ncbi:hypothetical protein AAG906_018739 [Vitis piasezkii]
MLSLPIWSHTIEDVDNIQPVVGKEIDIIKPAVVENSDSNLMVYSRRPRLPMQEQDPISLTHDQSSTPELRNHTLFIMQSPKKKITTLVIYVDDIIVTKNDVEEMQNPKGKLVKEFKIKDLGNLRYFLVIEHLVTWKSKKQHVVARSSAETKFRDMALGIYELMWLKGLLRELQVNLENPMRLYCDNKAAINIAHNLVQHDRTKHIDSGLICTSFVASKLQLADVFTKGVQKTTFNSMVSKLGIEDIFEPT